jgi:hypothetical protein
MAKLKSENQKNGRNESLVELTPIMKIILNEDAIHNDP